MVMQIELTRGQITIVDDIDADLADVSWYAQLKPTTYYARRTTYNPTKRFMMHQIIASRIMGRPILKSERIDHIDRNGLNNTRANLRITTPRGNGINTKLPSNNVSGFKGVNEQKGRWQASTTYMGKSVYIGRYDTPEEAHAAYLAKLEELGYE